MPGDVTLGELARRLDILHQDVRDMRSDLVKHDDLGVVNEAWRSALGRLEKDVSDLQSWQTWATRLIVGAVILAVVGLALTQAGP